MVCAVYDADQPFCKGPVRPNISLGDSLAGTSAALGTLLALIARGKMGASATRTGQTYVFAEGVTARS